jgi:two-component system, cell cycle response regulator DivK
MPKLLLVDDNEANCDMLSRRLNRKGYSVLIAGDGQAGIDLAQTDKPDVILMDVTLPVLDGIEAARRLKSDPDTNRIPIIALTAHAMEADRRKALEAGFDDFDTKPIDFARLTGKIQALLERTPVA